MSRMDEWNECGWKRIEKESGWMDVNRCGWVRTSVDELMQMNEEWEWVWLNVDEWRLGLSLYEADVWWGWVQANLGGWSEDVYGWVWMGVDECKWVSTVEWMTVDECRLCHTLKTKYALDPQLWVVVPAIVFDACGRMVIGGSGEVGECLSIDQSHFSYSVSLSSQDASSSSSQGSPDISCAANTF